MIGTFLMVSTSSITVQSLGKIVQRAPAVDAKIWCLFFFLPAGRPRSSVSRYLNLPNGQKISIFAPSGKTVNWIEKWLTHFRMGTTSSTIMQSLGEIEQRAPAVGAKIWVAFDSVFTFFPELIALSESLDCSYFCR